MDWRVYFGHRILKGLSLVTLSLTCEVLFPCQKMQAERTSGCPTSPPTTQLLEWGIIQRGACHCSHPQLQSPESDVLLENGTGKRVRRRPLKKIVSNIFPKELKVKPKDALKNCGGYGRRQMGGDSRYVLNL